MRTFVITLISLFVGGGLGAGAGFVETGAARRALVARVAAGGLSW